MTLPPVCGKSNMWAWLGGLLQVVLSTIISSLGGTLSQQQKESAYGSAQRQAGILEYENTAIRSALERAKAAKTTESIVRDLDDEQLLDRFKHTLRTIKSQQNGDS